MLRLTRLSIALCVLLVAAGAPAGQRDAGKAATMDLQLLDAIPADPLLVAVLRVEAPESHWDRLMQAIDQLVPEEQRSEVDEVLARIDEELGLSLRNDLLTAVGPEMALVIDLPPIDLVVGQVMGQTSEGIEQALGRISLLFQVRDQPKIDQALQKLFTKAGATIEPQDGFVQLSFPVSGPDQPPGHAYYGVRNGLLVLGFAADGVQAALAGLKQGGRLHDGADFQRIARHLDHSPSLLYYLNLPKLRDMVAASEMVQGATAANPEVQKIVAALLEPGTLPTGMAGTSQLTDDGMRRVSFGPSLLSGSFATGVLAGIIMPNLVKATATAKEKQTIAAMRSMGTAVEVYYVDNEAYLSSDGEWVGVDTIADELAPLYIREVSANDGWGNPYRFWSDGEQYLIVSTGADGELEAEWTVDAETLETEDDNADLVYSNGVFVRYPKGY